MKTGVTNANNPGTSATYTVAEGDTFVALATATDVDGAVGAVAPTIGVNGGADEAYFDFSGGQLSFNSPPDYEFDASVGQNNEYVVILTAFDALILIMMCIKPLQLE